ncbi:MAG: PLP-dependent aminotransferase family protein [Vulcanimicrobiota bacterium]
MPKLYEKVAEQINDLVSKGVYNYGERVPSVRHLSREMDVSTTTVVEAYRLLEDQGVLEARPKSGHFVSSHQPDVSQPLAKCPNPETAVPVSVADMVIKVMEDNQRGDLVCLGGADAAPDLIPTKRIQKAVNGALSEAKSLTHYDIPPGCFELRLAVAKMAVAAGCHLSPEEILLTNGCQEALTLCLRAVCQVGDVVAIESPTFYGQLQAIEMLGLRVLEIPSDPTDGMSLDALLLALDQMPVRAVVATPSHNNPTGSCMSADNRRELVDILAQAGVPLIEDDVYGDLGYGSRRIPAARSFDREGNVLYCSSLSKTLAPGYRLGWTAAGRYHHEVQKLKTLTNLASPSVLALGLAYYLQGNTYERCLRSLRREYARRTRAMREAVLAHFPDGTRVSDPRGGYVLWVELPRRINTLDLYPQARDLGIVYTPGPLFSAGKRYKHCLRLNAATWTHREKQAIETLGQLFKSVKS